MNIKDQIHYEIPTSIDDTRQENQWIIFSSQRRKEIEASGLNIFQPDNEALMKVSDLNSQDAGHHHHLKLEDEAPSSISDVKPKFYATTFSRKFI